MTELLSLPAIIGGSGLQGLPELHISERVDLETPWGKPSSLITVGRLAGQKVIFLARHSDQHGIPPHKVNYRANIAALVELGATCLFAFNAVGGIRADLGAGRLVVPHQIIDYTWGREHTYSDNANVPLHYVDFTEPYDAELRKALLAAAVKCTSDVAEQAVYGATQGPRLETAAEISRLERDGCDIVGMTGMPEAGLAREKNLPYACLALVVNPAAGKSGRLISFEEITQVMTERMPLVNTILAEVCNSALATQKHT